MHRTTKTTALLIAAAALAVPAFAHGAALTYSGVTSQVWSNPNTWAQVATPADGDTLTFATTTGNRLTTNDMTGLTLAGITITGNAYNISGNSVNMAGNISFTAGSTNQGTLVLPIVLQQNININVAATTGSGRLIINSLISGDFGVTKTGAGPALLSTAAKTYNGDTTILGGVLDATVNIPNGAGKGNLLIDTGAAFNINNANLAINGLNNGPNGAGNITRSGTNTRNLSIGNGNANGSFTGNITNAAASSTINKDGTGTQILGGTVTTATPIGANNGRLILNGTTTQGVNVGVNGLLGGSGTVAGTTTVNGKLAPGGNLAGDTTALLSVNNLTLNAAAITQITLAGTTRGSEYDALNVGGALVYGGHLSIAVPYIFTPGTYDLFAITGAISGNLASASMNGLTSLTNTAGVWTGQFDEQLYSFSQATGDLTVSYIPEPASAGVLALAALPLLSRRRRDAR